MQRIAFPSDVCPDPGARFHRSLQSAFPCSAAEAVTIYRPARRIRYGRWLALALLAMVLVVLTVYDRGVITPAPSAHEVKLAAAAAKACPGMHAEWEDDKTVRCLRESNS